VNASLSHQSADRGVSQLADTYLAKLEHAGRSAHTLRAYRSELARLAAFHSADVGELDVQVLRAFQPSRSSCRTGTFRSVVPDRPSRSRNPRRGAACALDQPLTSPTETAGAPIFVPPAPATTIYRN
jgi:hypothetical protein